MGAQSDMLPSFNAAFYKPEYGVEELDHAGLNFFAVLAGQRGYFNEPCGIGSLALVLFLILCKPHLHKSTQAFQTCLGALAGFSRDVITCVTTCQVAFVDQFFLVAGVIIQGCFGQADTLCDITKCGCPCALKIEQSVRLQKGSSEV